MVPYDDGRVACMGQEIIIRHYYAPFGAKHISYGDIREVRVVPLKLMGRWRIHGSGDLRHWFNFDPGRTRKRTALVIHLRQPKRFLPVITPDDPRRVADELTASGVQITSAAESGLF